MQPTLSRVQTSAPPRFHRTKAATTELVVILVFAVGGLFAGSLLFAALYQPTALACCAAEKAR